MPAKPSPILDTLHLSLGNMKALFAVYLLMSVTSPLLADPPAGELTQNSEPPQELKRLEFLVGSWDDISTYFFPGDLAPHEVKSRVVTMWSTNHQFLIADQQADMPNGLRDQLVLTSWDSGQKAYKVVLLEDNREPVVATTTEKDGAWRTLFYRNFQGRLIRIEVTTREISSREHSFHGECTDEGKTWICYDGTARKRE